MKFLILVALILSSSGPAYSSDGGRGGGGIKRNGEYLTFGSSKVQLRRAEVDQIPGIETLKNAILQLDLDLNIKGQLLGSVLPGEKRRYYYVDNISDAENARLLKIYKELVNTQPNDVVVLYAVTDPFAGETYLLPKFSRLNSETKQSHVLFHEAMWVLSPINTFHWVSRGGSAPIPYVTYEKVVNAEKAFGSYLAMKEAGQDIYPVDLYRRLSDVMYSPSILLVSALNYDVRKGNIKTGPLTITQTEFPLNSKLGKLPGDFTVIQGNTLFELYGEPGWYRIGIGSSDRLRTWALTQSMIHPERALYKALTLEPSACITNEKINAHDSAWLLDRLIPKNHYFLYDSEQKSVLTTGNESYRTQVETYAKDTERVWQPDPNINCLVTVSTP